VKQTGDISINEILDMLLMFRNERDWGQFHSPKNLAVSISIEAAELLEHFQWLKDGEAFDPDKKQDVARELADIFNYLVLLSNDLGIDLLGSSKMKIEENRVKYPVEKSRGTAKKYKEL